VKVLVTGGAGFIGGHLVEALLAAGHQVRILDSLLDRAHGVAPQPEVDPRAEWVLGDVRNPDTVTHALAGVEVVAHQAALVGLGVDLQDLPAYTAHNELGTAVLLAGMAAAGVRALVLASSMVVYGEGCYTCGEHGVVRPGPRREHDLAAGCFEPSCPLCGRPLAPGTVPEDAPLDPRNAYAASKAAQEHLARAWVVGGGGSAIALRYHNVYGPRMPHDTPYAGVASLFRSALERGEAPRVYEDGRQRRDFVHVGDVAAAGVAAVEAVATGRVEGMTTCNIASGTPHTVGELAASLAAATAGPAPVVTGQYRLGDVRHVVADPSRAARLLGFHARIGFSEGVREFATAPLRPTGAARAPAWEGAVSRLPGPARRQRQRARPGGR
jgi:dTDP-L-rhamnose 4-epimerase